MELPSQRGRKESESAAVSERSVFASPFEARLDEADAWLCPFEWTPFVERDEEEGEEGVSSCLAMMEWCRGEEEGEWGAEEGEETRGEARRVRLRGRPGSGLSLSRWDRVLA